MNKSISADVRHGQNQWTKSNFENPVQTDTYLYPELIKLVTGTPALGS